MRSILFGIRRYAAAESLCRPSRHNALTFRSYSTHYDSDQIPLHGNTTTIPSNNLEGTTITPKERDVFQRLFQNVIRDAAVKKSTPQHDQDSANASVDLDEPEVRSREELIDSVLKFPQALRDIALSTAERIERNAWQAARRAKYDAENETLAISAEAQQRAEHARAFQEAELARLTELIQNAQTDLAIWNVLENEMFTKVSSLRLDDVVAKHINLDGRKEEPSSKKGENAITTAQLLTNVSNFGVLYPAILNQAVHTWRKRFPTSVLPFSVLPCIKQLGRASYALGASAKLYHQLIEFTWNMTGDFAPTNGLLREMDDEGFEFSDETFAIVRKIQRHWEGRLRKSKTRLEYVVLRMGMVNEEFTSFKKWRDVIEERLDAQALRQANQKIAEHTV